MHSHLPLYFLVTSQLSIIISLWRHLSTRPISYKGGGVVHDKRYDMTLCNPKSLIGGNILVSILIDVSKCYLSSLDFFIL